MVRVASNGSEILRMVGEGMLIFERSRIDVLSFLLGSVGTKQGFWMPPGVWFHWELQFSMFRCMWILCGASLPI